jgi:metallophosphoesterase superfamily enzyme
MQIKLSEEVVLDSRRAVFLPRQDTIVLADLFLGLGAVRRKRLEHVPSSQYYEIWEHLLGLLEDFRPRRVVLLGDIKPNQGCLEDPLEQEELRNLLGKLKKNNRDLIQVVSNPERTWGPSLEGTGIKLVSSYRVGSNTLIHRRRTFVYPRHDPFSGFWINGGLHPIFTLPIVGNDGNQESIRHAAFLHTGFALVMPSFVSYARGWEVMRPERLPKQARAWKLVGDYNLVSIKIADLVSTNECLMA